MHVTFKIKAFQVFSATLMLLALVGISPVYAEEPLKTPVESDTKITANAVTDDKTTAGETVVTADTAPTPEASSVAEPDTDTIPPLKRLIETGTELTYLGYAHGMHGWLALKEGRIQILYTNNEAKAVVNGILYGPDGQSVTAQQLAALRQSGFKLDEKAANETIHTDGMHKAESVVRNSPGEQLMVAVSKARWFPVGKDNAPILYIVVDAECPHCKQFFQNLDSTFIETGQVQVRLVPVSFLGEASTQLGAAILSAEDPASSWRSLMKDGGAALATQTISPTALTAVQENTLLMSKWNVNATPYSIYRGRNGRVKIISGRPQDVGSVVVDVSN